MSKVRFDMAVWKATVNGQPIGQSFQDGTYICDELYDCSGDYYPAADVERLEEAIKYAIAEIEAEWGDALENEDLLDGQPQKIYRRLKAAIADMEK